MKTAEQWHHTKGYLATMTRLRCECTSCCNARAIQLDAFKAGMAEAAAIADSKATSSPAAFNMANEIRDEIRTHARSKTL